MDSASTALQVCGNVDRESGALERLAVDLDAHICALQDLCDAAGATMTDSGAEAVRSAASVLLATSTSALVRVSRTAPGDIDLDEDVEFEVAEAVFCTRGTVPSARFTALRAAVRLNRAARRGLAEDNSAHAKFARELRAAADWAKGVLSAPRQSESGDLSSASCAAIEGGTSGVTARPALPPMDRAVRAVADLKAALALASAAQYSVVNGRLESIFIPTNTPQLTFDALIQLMFRAAHPLLGASIQTPGYAYKRRPPFRGLLSEHWDHVYNALSMHQNLDLALKRLNPAWDGDVLALCKRLRDTKLTRRVESAASSTASSHGVPCPDVSPRKRSRESTRVTVSARRLDPDAALCAKFWDFQRHVDGSSVKSATVINHLDVFMSNNSQARAVVVPEMTFVVLSTAFRTHHAHNIETLLRLGPAFQPRAFHVSSVGADIGHFVAVLVVDKRGAANTKPT